MPCVAALPHRAVLSGRARLPMGSCRDPQHVVAGHIDADSRRTRIVSALGFGPFGIGQVQRAEEERTGKALRGMCDAAAQCSQ
jgi:hypothetical protein